MLSPYVSSVAWCALSALQLIGAVLVERPTSVAVTSGYQKSVTFYCTTDSPSTHTVDWCIDASWGQASSECPCQLPYNSSGCKHVEHYVVKNVTVRHADGKQQHQRYSLTVVGVTRSDVGKYTCRERQAQKNFSDMQCAHLHAFRGAPVWNVTLSQHSHKTRRHNVSESAHNDENINIGLAFTFDVTAKVAINVHCRSMHDGLTVVREAVVGKYKQWIFTVNDTSLANYNCTTEVFVSSPVGCHDQQMVYIDVQNVHMEQISEAWAITANVVAGLLGAIIVCFIAGLLMYSACKHFKLHKRNTDRIQQQNKLESERKPLSHEADDKTAHPDVV